jgi:two-component system, NarL family, response regulator LiaR
MDGMGTSGATGPRRAGARTIRLTLVDEDQVVRLGVAAMLGAGASDVVLSEPGVPGPVDIALYDPAGRHGHRDPVRLVADPNIARVVAYTWNFQPWLARDLARSGVAGLLSKRLTGPQLVRAVRQIHAGTFVVAPEGTRTRAATGDWPGKDSGLTLRESEVLALITRGLSNQDIAARLHVSPNSVKSYIRSCYRKIGARTRSQAVIWGLSQAL